MIGEAAVVDVLRRAGLTRPVFRLLERYRAARAGRIPAVGADGLPLPPPLLMVQVAGHADHVKFYEGGRLAARDVSEAMSRQGVDLADLDAILDFGVGCGRVVRHWKDLGRPRIFGTDYNERLVAWCNENLHFVAAHTNELEPQLPCFSDAQFDLVYAISVFTHLTEDKQRGWIGELHRVLKPGGFLVFSTAGARFRAVLARFDSHELAAFDRGELVVTDEDVEGTNRCNAYHPEGWIERELLDGFALAEFTPAAVASAGGQDLYVLEKR